MDEKNDNHAGLNKETALAGCFGDCSIDPMHQGCRFDPGQGTYRNQQMNV